MNHSVKNPFKNTRIEFHILQSFPVTCLNRDDVGAPKTAIIGGVQRARVSSQSWKRAVRLAMHDFGAKLGIRTKAVSNMIADACLDEGATEEQAHACGTLLSSFLVKHTEKKAKAASKKKTDNGNEVIDVEEEAEADSTSESTLLFFTHPEAHALAVYAKENYFNAVDLAKKAKPAEVYKLVKENLNLPLEGVDIALFGRMVAKASELNIEAATSFSHAISTHKVSNELDFFTALDDASEVTGAAHMGGLEFNSSTYYRYISLDLGQLYDSMCGELMSETVEQFTKALFVAIPAARQKTQSGASPWDFAKIMVRKGQPLQASFETSIKSKDGGFLNPSIDALKSWVSKQEKMHGSLFGKIGEYTYGEDENFSIDDLIAGLQKHVVGV